MTAERSAGERRDPTDSSPSTAGTAADPTTSDPDKEASPSDAFQALGNETRTAIVRRLAADAPLPFSDLYEATDEDTSAGFAYHLRQLVDRFVRQRDDERYELTDAGRAVARDLRAGTFTESVDRGPVDLPEDCPLCGTAALAATVADNVTEVACEACEASLLSLSVPPGGYDHDGGFADAVDAHYRRRIDSFTSGVCPACAGPVETTIEYATDEGGDDGREEAASDDPRPVQASFGCDTCGESLRCPVALTLLSHPAVVTFYHGHGEDVRERPVWNVGTEWRERLVSADPWCVAVSTRLDDECLFLYVARDGRVVDHRRQPAPDVEVLEAEDFSGDDTDDDPDGGDPQSVDSTDPRTEDPPTADDGELDHAAATDGATA